jgi:acetylglutamate synthase
MATTRSTTSPTLRPFVTYLGSGNGNSSPLLKTEAQRLTHMEELLLRMQTVLETQFQRMADMQVFIDRLNAERHR